MAAPSITTDAPVTHTFTFLSGPIVLANGEVVEDITRANVDGVAYKKRGKKGIIFTKRAINDFESVTDAWTAHKNYTALKGELVTLIDDYSYSWANIMVLDWRLILLKQSPVIVGARTATPTHILQGVFTLQHTDTGATLNPV